MNLGSFLKMGDGNTVSRRSLVRIAAGRLKISEATALTDRNRPLDWQTESQLMADFQALVNGKPEAYVLGNIPFLNHLFKIDTRALIPRPETEDLCAKLIDHYKSNPTPTSILDLCCGSGVMGLSMVLAFPNSKVLLTDISQEALSLCEENIIQFNLEGKAQTAFGDLWEAVPTGKKFQLIIANPPYVGTTDPVENSVLDYEPHQALYSDDEGLAHIKKIIARLPSFLADDSLAAFELGHRHREILDPWLAQREDYKKFQWRQDPFGIYRFLFYYGSAEAPESASGKRG